MINYSHHISATLFGAVATIILVQSPSIAALEPTEISRIAKEFTVRIEGADTGSGVIIERNGNTYTVLTNWHVVDYKGQYQAITPDGKKHDFTLERVTYLPGIDLAKVQFTSEQDYTVAEIGNSETMSEGAPIFMAGYPDASYAVTESAYYFDGAQIVSRLQNPDSGYSLVFNKPGTPGTSGGGLLDNNARLVGINGRSKTDINVGKAFGLGIPIQTFVKAKNNFQIPLEALPPEDVLDRGKRLYREGRYSEAIVELNQALKIEPNDYELLQIRAIVNYNLGNYRAVITDLNQVVKLNRESDGAYNNLGVAYAALGDSQQAITSYNQAIKLEPESARYYYNRGNTYYKLGEYQQPIEDFDQAIQINPAKANAYGNRGECYRKLGNYKQALIDLNQGIQLNQEDSVPYLNRGLVYHDLGDYQKALRDYGQSIQLNPKDDETYFRRGNTYYKLKDYQKAITDYTQAVQLNPNDFKAYNNRGLAQHKLGNFNQAIEDYNQALQINPQYADSYNNRGNTYRKLGEFQKAIADYKQAIRINPEYAMAYANFGLLYRDMGDKQKAIANFRRAAEIFQQQRRTRLYQRVMNLINQLE